ncbi:MAG: hypothetical protein IJ867_01755 [Clostridia bacterium]|nr:hypothetical protein [Clostridia bacterium]
MLILAGVSLNAIIGDNGIISNAQQANMKTGMAVLEEFLQEKYVENFEIFDNDDSKVVQLQRLYPEFFYMPVNEGIGGLRYIVDSKGHALYLIKKSGLPKDIKKQLVGGDAGDETYSDYANLNDVYGVTGELRVYYSSGSGSSALLGITEEEFDDDDSFRVVFQSSKLNDLLIKNGFDTTSENGEADGKINVEEMKSIKELKISDSDGVTDFKDFYNLTNLMSLVLTNYTGSLEGLQNCPRICQILLRNCSCPEYTQIGGINKQLIRLYMTNCTNEVVNQVCEDLSKVDFPNLSYFGIIGNVDLVWSYSSTSDWWGFQYERSNGLSSKKSANLVTDISCLSKLTTVTKEAVKYLYLYCNEIEDTYGENGLVSKYALENISGFKNVEKLRVEYNQLSSLKGIENFQSLRYIFAVGNQLGKFEVYNPALQDCGKNESVDSLASLQRLKNLNYVDLRYNANLKYLEYILNCSAIDTLYLSGCLSLVGVAEVKEIINKCGNTGLDSKYALDILDEETTKELDLCEQTITISNLESVGKCKKLTKLGMRNTIITDDLGGELTDDFISQELKKNLKGLSNLAFVTFQNLKGLKDLDFINDWNEDYLIELDLRDTDVINLEPVANHCFKLRSLILNNDSIILKNYIALIDRLSDNGGFSWSWDGNAWTNGNGGGLCLLTEDLVDQLTKCEGLENFCLYNNFGCFKKELDLTGITTLKRVGIMNLKNYSNIKIPSNIEKLYFHNGKLDNVSFIGTTSRANYVKLYSINFKNDINAIKKIQNYFYATEKINYFELCESTQINFVGEFDVTKKIKTLKSYLFCYTPATLAVSGLYNWLSADELQFEKVNLTGLDNLKLVGATSLQITKCGLTNCSFLDGYTQLVKLILNRNKIASINEIKSLTNLSYLNLVENSIGEFSSSYNSETNAVEKINVVSDIFIPMSKKSGGNLEYLYLNGNTDILSINSLKDYYDSNKRSGF